MLDKIKNALLLVRGRLRATNWKRLAIMTSIKLLMIGTIVFVGVNFLNKNEVIFQSPIVLRSPVYWIPRADREVLSPIAYAMAEPITAESKEALINATEHAEIIHKIWILETSKGAKSYDPTALHEHCNKLGLSNEFGFDPFNKFCFADFKASIERVNQWFSEKLETMSKEEAICLYNTGYRIKTCEYLTRFNSL